MAAFVLPLPVPDFIQETAPAYLLPYGLAAAAVLVVVIILLYRRRRPSSPISRNVDDTVIALTLLEKLAHLPAAEEGDSAEQLLKAATDIFPGRAVELGEYGSGGYRTLARRSDGRQAPDYELSLLDDPTHPLAFLRGHTLPITGAELASSDIRPVWPELNQLGSGHSLYLPLHDEHGSNGLFILVGEAPFVEKDLMTAQTIQPVLAMAMRQIQLNDEIEVRSTQLFMISEISRRLISLQPLESRMGAVAPLISQIFDYAEVAVYGWDDQGAMLMAASHEVPDRGAHEQDATLGLVGDSAREGRKKEHTPPSDIEGEPAAEIALPLMIEDRLLGVLHIRDQEGRIFEAERQAIAEMIGAQLAIAILEARNYSSQQEYTWINTVLLEVARHAAQPGDPDDALRAVLQLATLLAGAEWAAVFLADETGTVLRLGPNAGVDRETTGRLETLTFSPQDFSLGDPAVESQAPIPIRLPEELQAELETEAPLGLVMSDGRHLIGVLLIGGPEPVGPRRALLAGIAHQVSLRLENSRLVDELAAQRSLERELAMARGIQESFLPDFVPQYPGWDVGATWVVARQVGGDFFDFIDLPEQEAGSKVGVVIADVADKGIPAALFMALCITLLRSVATTLSSPAMVLSRLNELLFSQTRPDMFVSVFYAVLDIDSDTLTFANGGHNPPIHLDRNGNWVLLKDHGMVLGVSEQADYRDHTIQLQPDERLVLYTDGVTEATARSGELFGLERLAVTVKEGQSKPSQQLAQKVNQAVIDFCAGDPSDDLTTVILRRTREPDPSEGAPG